MSGTLILSWQGIHSGVTKTDRGCGAAQALHPSPSSPLPCVDWTQHLQLVLRAQRQKEKSKHMFIYLRAQKVRYTLHS